MIVRNGKPTFLKQQDSDLFLKLRHEVNETVRALEPQRKFEIVIKAILFPALYLGCYITALLYGSNVTVLYLSYFGMGILLILNFLNLIHEAVHHTLFKNKRLNNWYVHFFDLMGANSYIWKIRHIRLHHNYPNVMGWDSDIEQSPMARIFPHGAYSRIHKYQHIYLPFLYPLFLFNWLLVRDFKDFFNKKKLVWKVTSIPAIEYVKLFLFKLFFIFYTVILPVWIIPVSFVNALIAFIILVFSASFLALVVLLSPHASLESEYPLPDENGNMPMDWFKHQLSCTNDVKEDNWFTRFFMGCFNYHIAHHLFPSINHVYYPEITKIIQQFAVKNNLPYRKFPLVTSLKNHYLLLKNNACPENIFEETM
jgi:linoleoyl-CoA desaturase